jgi:4-cresol dehydrogenase (hydroxylating) flavoprotein subunit
MAERVLPPGVSAARFDAALAAFAHIVGSSWVWSSEADLQPYFDLYPLGAADEHAPAAAVAPETVEQIQALVRLANEYKTPLWPISRGKNLGYGGAAPRLRGSVVLDLGRMRRIVEVDARYGYCIVEPGVGFFDLFEHLRSNRIPLWLAVPGTAWGSVLGNALDRGNSTFPYGDHAGKICGLEVVLPDGSLLRTGMGAMRGNPTWPLFKYGYGPSWDQLFTQSNFGIVTKLGLWLMPEPEATLTLSMELPNADDVNWAIETLFPLKAQGVLQQNPAVGNYMRVAGIRSRREQWFRGEGAMSDSAIAAMLKALGIGWWGINLRLYGHAEVNAVHARIVKEAFAQHTKQEFRTSAWRRGDALEGSGAGIPSTSPMQLVDWYGGRGAHLTFSPVLPPSGGAALQQLRSARRRFDEYGLDFYGGFTLGERHMIATSGIIYDLDDRAMTGRARQLFAALLGDARRAGYGEYRTHLSFMDAVADSFDFNDHALRRLNETVKNALDPNGILAPGKQGIWPRNYKP